MQFELRLGANQEKVTGSVLAQRKEFVEKNGGHIEVESSVGTDTTFRFTVLSLIDNI